MSNTEQSSKESFGEAITELGLWKDFLSEKKHMDYSLPERSALIKGIVSKQLESGNWKEVINMVYGGFGGADQLYDGDLGKLEKEIVKSTKLNPDNCVDIDIEKMLKEKNSGFLFKLATALPLNYKQFCKVNFDQSFFEDPEKVKNYHTHAANKALQGNDVRSAFYHYKTIEAKDEIDNLFETNFKEGKGPLKEIALYGNPDKRDQRLKELIVQKKVSPTEAYKLSKKHRISLTKRQSQNLIKRVAADLHDTSRNSFQNKLDVHYDWQCPEKGEIELSWAKKNIESEPGKAYSILRNQEKPDNEIKSLTDKAVIAALKLNKSENEYQRKKGLDMQFISKENLQSVYEQVPFNTKIQIARRLIDNDRLMELSRQASNKDCQTAYDLWFEAGGREDDEFINPLREMILDKALAKERFWRINNKDSVGQNSLLDRMMSKKGLEEDAYRNALEIGDEEKISLTRTAYLHRFGVRKSLRMFSKPNYNSEERDEDGINYVAGIVAKKYGIDPEELMSIL